MKIGFISDLHFNLLPQPEEAFNVLCQEVNKASCDVLVIPGDIAEDVIEVIDIVNRLVDSLRIPVYYVPGNHDIWYKDNKLVTDSIYRQFAEDPNCLIDKTIDLGDDLVLVGDIFWYDYSFANQSKYTKKQLSFKTYGERTWNDYFYVNWLMSDEDRNASFIEKMEERLKSLNGKRVILISHMVNHEAFTVPEDKFEMWGYMNAFLGSRSLYQLIKDYNVEIAACGHVHHRRMFKEDQTTFICSCLGYEKEWPMFDEHHTGLAQQIQQALTVVDVAL